MDLIFLILIGAFAVAIVLMVEAIDALAGGS